MASNKELTETIKKITRQLSGETESDGEDLIPHYTIKGNGESYYFSYIDRSFIKITKGLQVFVVCEKFDNMERTLVYTSTHELILIEPDELDYIGFN